MTTTPDYFALGYEAGRASRVTHPLTDEQRREAVRLLRPYVLALAAEQRGGVSDGSTAVA